jgi:hypothetical protein
MKNLLIAHIVYFVTFNVIFAQQVNCIFDSRYIKNIDGIIANNKINKIRVDKDKERYWLILNNKDSIYIDNYSCESYGVEILLEINKKNLSDTSKSEIYERLISDFNPFIKSYDTLRVKKYFTKEQIIKIGINKKKKINILDHGYDVFYISVEINKDKVKARFFVSKT